MTCPRDAPCRPSGLRPPSVSQDQPHTQVPDPRKCIRQAGLDLFRAFLPALHPARVVLSPHLDGAVQAADIKWSVRPKADLEVTRLRRANMRLLRAFDGLRNEV